MLTYNRIKMLCKEKGVTVTGTEKALGFARGSLCKVDTNKPSMEKVQKLANYFNVSVSYLMGENESNKLMPELTVRDERDIKKVLDSLREKLLNKDLGPAAYDGEDIPDDDIELFLGQVDLMLHRLKAKNKVKYGNKNKK